MSLSHPTSLSQWQQTIQAFETKRGFDRNVSDLQTALKLVEELGEFCKAVLAKEGLVPGNHSALSSISDELADVTICVLALANRYEVNLQHALETKLAAIEMRK